MQKITNLRKTVILVKAIAVFILAVTFFTQKSHAGSSAGTKVTGNTTNTINTTTTATATPGEAAPAFELKGHDGKNYGTAAAKNKWIVLEWFNHDCPFVKKHYDEGNMQGLQKQFKKIKGVELAWYTIISSAPGKAGYLSASDATQVLKTNNSSATAILFDPDGRVGHAYDAMTTPHMAVIEPNGTLAYMGAIDDHPSTDAADIPKSRNYVKEVLEKANKGEKITYGKTKGYGCSVKY